MPMGFELGPLYIRFYGIILMVGALAAAFLADRLARRRGLDGEIVWDALIWVLIGGIIGARLWHIFTPPPSMAAPPPLGQGLTTAYYLTHPLDVLAIWKGGLGIPGAVIGGIFALYLYCRRRKLDFLVWADIAAPALALGQAIGRWGNYINQELYGSPTNLPWGITINPAYRLAGYEIYERFHPLFLYESLYSLANMAALLWIGRRFANRLKPGDIFLFYLVFYPLGRFLIEFLRLDNAKIAGLNANQTVMGVVAVVALVTLIWRHRKGATPAAQAPSEETVVEPQGDSPEA
jgi:phosphatidylglycerol:prolipoprotein diacylglycerol transferase